MFPKGYFPEGFFPQAYFPDQPSGGSPPPATVYGYQSEDERAALAAISHKGQQMPWWLRYRRWGVTPR